jgi:hypothetical protein
MKSSDLSEIPSGVRFTKDIQRLNRKYGAVLRVIYIAPNQPYCGKTHWVINYAPLRDLRKMVSAVYGKTLKEAEFELANHAQKLCEYREME